MAVLTDEQQAFVGPIAITGMSAHRAGFARVVCVYLDGHRTMQKRFIGNHALQFSKRPLGVGGIGTPLLLRRFLASLATGPISDIGQVLQSDEAVWVLGHDALRDHMIGVLLQPSLPSTDGKESPRCGTGAFLLQTLSQSRVVVSFGNDSLPRMERMLCLRRRRYRQIANTDIHPSYTTMSARCWLCYLDLKGNQQVELVLWFIVPEFCSTDLSTLGNKRPLRVKMLKC